ncbi:MAG: IPT/TIG domain-containing protein [Aliidongia sp.]
MTAPGGISATSVAVGYTYAATPRVSAITPASGPAAGGTVVTITGANLTGCHCGAASAPMRRPS